MEFKAIFQHCLALFRCKLLKLIHLVMEFKAMFQHCLALISCKLLKLIHLVMELKAMFQHCLALFRCKLLKLIHLVMEFKAIFQHCLALISCKWSKVVTWWKFNVFSWNQKMMIGLMCEALLKFFPLFVLQRWSDYGNEHCDSVRHTE